MDHIYILLSVDFLLYQVKGMTVLEYLLKFDSSEEVKRIPIDELANTDLTVNLLKWKLAGEVG